MSIERLDPADVRPFEMTTEHAAAILDDAARSIVLQARFYCDYGTALSVLPPNTMLAPREAAVRESTPRSGTRQVASSSRLTRP